jgi:mercuric ion transport protein
MAAVAQREEAMQRNGRTAAGAARRADSRRLGVVAAGGVLGALAATSCCIAPLVLFSLGVSGAWIGNLTALEPYQPIFIGATFAFLAAGYYLVYRRQDTACADTEVCTRPLPRRGVKLALWAATVLAASAMAFPYIARRLLGI